MTEHLQRNPTYEKGKGRPLPAQGAQLANLTTIKLSRKKCLESSGRTCVESMLCKVHPELYIPPSTQPIKNAPDLYHSRGWVCCADWKLSRQGWCPVVWWGDLNWLSGLAVVLWSDGLIWWSGRDDGLVWYSDVVVWSGLWSDCLVWWSDRLASWSNLEVCLRNMVWSDSWKLKR